MDSPERPLLLLSNDDGIAAEGLKALEQSLAPLGRTVIVAPLHERSASSRAITLRRPLRCHRQGSDRYGVDGTPADSVMLAVTHLLHARADLVVTGINNGPNMGDNVHYSGTVGAAAEGARFGIPAIAVSVDQRVDVDFRPAGRVAAAIAARVLDNGLPPGVVLNVNVPRGSPSGLQVTCQSGKISRNFVLERPDPHGRPYFWLHEEVPTEAMQEGSDYATVQSGFVSVTPLQFDHTAHSYFEELRSDLEGCSFGPERPGG